MKKIPSITVQEVIIQSCKFVGWWFLISVVIALFADENVLIFLVIFPEPIFGLLDLFSLYLPSFLAGGGASSMLSIMLLVWAGFWVGAAWVYLWIKRHPAFLAPNRYVLAIFAVFLVTFSPLVFSCGHQFEDVINDPKYCPASSSWSSSERVDCGDPRFTGQPGEDGACILSTSGTEYNCLTCKYLIGGLYQFKRPGNYDFPWSYWIFSALLLVTEYLLSCLIYQQIIRKRVVNTQKP